MLVSGSESSFPLPETGLIEKSTDSDLPASSARRFLQVKRDMPLIVLTNYEKSFVNPYYNSIFDAYGFRLDNITKQAEKLHNLVASVSNTVLRLITSPQDQPGPLNVSTLFHETI